VTATISEKNLMWYNTREKVIRRVRGCAQTAIRSGDYPMAEAVSGKGLGRVQMGDGPLHMVRETRFITQLRSQKIVTEPHGGSPACKIGVLDPIETARLAWIPASAECARRLHTRNLQEVGEA
jgi:hypothetical protein